jgi:hypothetical protein
LHKSFLSFFFALALLLSLVSPTGLHAQFVIYENGGPIRRGSDLGFQHDTPTRTKIDLTGNWRFSIDQQGWHDIRIPSSLDYVGRVIYMRKFTLEQKDLQSRSFKFVALGINNDAEVYFNETFVGKHVGGSVSFELEIASGVLQIGSENVVKIIISNIVLPMNTLPVRKQIFGWRNFNGIIRDIYLLSTPLHWIDDLGIRAELDSTLTKGKINFNAILNARMPEGVPVDSLPTSKRTMDYVLITEIYDRQGTLLIAQAPPVAVTVEENKSVSAQWNMTVVNPLKWSPETPDFYILRVSLARQEGRTFSIVDVVEKTIGFSRISVSGDKLFQNGAPLTLRGVTWVEDAPQYGASLTYEQMEKDVAMMKMLGANAVRFAFHQPHPYMIELCTRFGLLALLELPTHRTPSEILVSETFLSLSETMLSEMIRRDRHQVCVLAWGLGSGFDASTPASRSFVLRLVDKAKSMDCGLTFYGSAFINNDVATDIVDLSALVFRDVDVKSFKESIVEWKKKHPYKPLIVLEYGKRVEPRNHNGYSDPMSEEAQGRYFIQYYGIIRDVKIAGSFVNAFADWRGDRPIFSVRLTDVCMYPYGIMTYDRDKRAAYDVVKSLYKNERVTALTIGTYRGMFPIVHLVAGLIIIFLLAYQYNYNRRFNETFKRSLMHPYNFFSDLRDLRVASGVQTLLLGVLMSFTLGTILSSLLYYYKTSLFADDVLSQIIVSDALKTQVIHATWEPVQGVIEFSLFFFVALLAFTVLVRLGAVVLGARVHWFNSFAVSVWASVPIVFLSFLGMILFKLLDNQLLGIPAVVLIVAVLIWVLTRLVQGIAVMYDARGLRVYLGGAAVIIIVLSGITFFYVYFYAADSYIEFLINLAKGSA